MDNVHELNIPPKTRTELYRKKYTITVTFLPDTKLWQWSFPLTFTRVINGTAANMQRAFQQAKKRIDEIER